MFSIDLSQVKETHSVDTPFCQYVFLLSLFLWHRKLVHHQEDAHMDTHTHTNTECGNMIDLEDVIHRQTTHISSSNIFQFKKNSFDIKKRKH